MNSELHVEFGMFDVENIRDWPWEWLHDSWEAPKYSQIPGHASMKEFNKLASRFRKCFHLCSLLIYFQVNLDC